MSDRKEKAIEGALDLRAEVMHEIKHGKLSRREMNKKLLLAGGALAALWPLRATNKAWAKGGAEDVPDGDPVDIALGPVTTPFVDDLVHVNRDAYVKQPQDLSPEPAYYAQTTVGECGRGHHQAWDAHWRLASVRKTYLLTQKLVKARFHRDLPLEDVWGFDGAVPGPTFRSRYGEPCIVRIVNELPPIGQHYGYGLPETTTHLHNGHTPSESDGNPDDYMPRQAELSGVNDDGRFRDHHYPNIYAGDDPREALGTLWYHDHRHNFTAPNVYRGLAGFHLMFDEVDSGNENDSNPRALKLPSGEYDVPLMIADRFFHLSGQSLFNQLDPDGFLGNKYVVNGKVQPKFRVEARKYRLRMLNGSVSRSFGLSVMVSDSPNGPVNATLIPGAVIIGTGGNLLPAPLPLRIVNPLGSSQRLDVVVDFSTVTPGKYVYLVNRWAQFDGRGPGGFLSTGPDGPRCASMAGPEHVVMRFDVVPAMYSDPSRVPAILRELPWQNTDAISKLSESAIRGAIGKSKPFPGVERVREWRFERTPNGMWAVNSQLYDGATPAARCGKDTGEIWVLQSGGGWMHPIHLHLEEHRTLYREGIKPKAQHLEYGRDDTMLMGEGERAIIFRKFRDFTGKYVMHCHNTVHEDHAMMIRFDIV